MPPAASSLDWNRFSGGLFLAGLCLGGFLGGGGSDPMVADSVDRVPFRGISPGEFQSEAGTFDTGRLPVPVTADAAMLEAVQGLLRAAAVAMGNNNLASARTSLKRVLELQPENLSALMNLGWVAQREKAWTEAEECFSQAQRLAPKNPAVWLALGLSVLEQGRLEHALGAFAQVIAHEPRNARGHRLLGLTLARKGWLGAAEEELRRSLEIEPEDSGAHFNLAVVYLQRVPAAVEMARRHYFRAVDLGAAPDDSMESRFAGDAPPEEKKTSSAPVLVPRVASGETGTGLATPLNASSKVR